MKIIYKHLLAFPLIIGLLYSIPSLIVIGLLKDEKWTLIVSMAPLGFALLTFVGCFVTLFARGYFRMEKFGGISSVPIRLDSNKTTDEIANSIRFSADFIILELNDDLIKLKSKMKDFSWGEYIWIRKQKIQNGIIQYMIESKPIFIFNIFTFGTNYARINELRQLINK